MSDRRPGPGIDTSVPHVARIWNHWLGGEDDHPVDREAGGQVLGMLPDVARLARASRLAGGHLAVYDGTNVVHGEASDRIVGVWNASGNARLVPRTAEEIERFFDGLELVETGIVPVTRWRPDAAAGEPEAVDAYGAVGRKP